MKLYLSKKTHVLLITILFVSQIVASSFLDIQSFVAGAIVSTIILLFYLGYAKAHHSSLEVYALFQLLSLTIVFASTLSLFTQVVLNHVSLFTNLYSITVILSITLVNFVMNTLYKRIKR